MPAGRPCGTEYGDQGVAQSGNTGTSAEPYLYAGAWGYRSDGDAGLMLVGARCYDAQAGRFVTRDTLLGEHPYLYCEHEPVGSVDPSGHWPDKKGKQRLTGNDPLNSLSDDELDNMYRDKKTPPDVKERIKALQKARGIRRSHYHRAVQAGADAGLVVAVGIGTWEIGKWILAIVLAPETAGGSLAAATVVP
ncbi:MAG: hypothetical protein IT208_08785 [Chthonomonadales bacterium]|nr:hypothetical protein [Chthonomonadales bacterium]